MEKNRRKKQQNVVKRNTCMVTRKQPSTRSYGSLFLKRQSMKRRGEKSIYVQEEYHDRLNKILLIIGGGNIPLYAYLDNILKNHFDDFEKEIIKEFNKMNKPLF